MTKQFQVGETYETRTLCDHECVFSFTIEARTAKTVTTRVSGKTVRRGVYLWDEVEQFRPYGTYSMCPIVGADDLVSRTVAIGPESDAERPLGDAVSK